MDTISLYKHRIDALMDILFGAGVSNPQTIIEQLNYLLFLRALSIKDDEAELLGITDESEKIFTGDLAKYRWQNLLALNAEDLFKTLEVSFDVLQKKSKNPTVKLLFRNAHIKIFDKPTLRRVLHEIETFAKELDAIAHEGNKDVFGDMYEYLLSKLSSAGTNGQFRTPRHIIDFMVKVVDPKKNETILDPACGTAGFLVAAYRYIAGEYTSDKLKKAGSPRAMDKLSASEKQFLFNHMFTGFDSDEDMIKFGMMNLHLHGLTKSRLARQNSLTDTTGMKDKFDVILANPPFSGKIDEESVSEDLRMGTKATELLFLRFMMDHLSLKGKLAVIVPEGVVFNTSKAHAKIRQMLIEKGLWAIVSLPSGIFNPYAGVKTSLLFIDKEIAKTKDEILFIKIGGDGFDLGAQRRPVEKNDLPAALEIINEWKAGQKVENDLAIYLEKSRIANSGDNNLSVDHYREKTNYTNNKWPTVDLVEVCVIRKGTSITKKDVTEGLIPVVAGGQQPAYYHNKANRDGKTITVSASGAYAGFVNYFDTPIFASDCTTIQAKESSILLTDFVFLILKSQQEEIFKLQKGGAQPHVYPKDLEKIKIPLPPINIQKLIIGEVGEYQKIIDGARQVVENWKPNIEINPAWKVIKLGEICELRSGGTPSRQSNSYWAGNVPWYSSGELNELYTTEPKEMITQLGVENSNATLFPKGSLLVGLYDTAALKMSILDRDATFNQAVCGIKPNENIDLMFLHLFILEKKDEYLTQRVGVRQRNLSKGFIENIEVPVPPLEVQKEIVKKVEFERTMIENAKGIIPIFEQKIKNRLAKLWSA